MEIVHEIFNIQSFVYSLIKAERRRVFTVKLEINTIFTLKSTQSLAILMIMSATRFLLFSEFYDVINLHMKTATSVSFKVGRI